MSTWTHVCGVIRIDSIRILNESKSLYNIISDFQNMSPPYGSEGGLTITGWEDSDISSLAAFTISIHGDLRDYDDVEEIVDWIEKVIRLNNLDIRQGICDIQVGGGESFVWDFSLPKITNVKNSTPYLKVNKAIDATNERIGTDVIIYRDIKFPYTHFIRDKKEFILKFKEEEE